MVAVAQLVESRIVIPVVVGSSPISHPKIQCVAETILRANNRGEPRGPLRFRSSIAEAKPLSNRQTNRSRLTEKHCPQDLDGRPPSKSDSGVAGCLDVS